MALATRELELILIARDHASAVIARVGGAMVILGGIVAATGVKGVKELGEMTREAAEFRQEIALAVTQADGLGANITNVADIVNRVGTDIPVPFQELNEAMFDIFSTFTSDQLSSLEQAEDILRLFGESAVAGQAPVRDIARSTIAWINALDQPATVENVTRLLDVQFELIRKGAGTYGEFAGEVGKSIPAFAAANQSVETFGGIMAFLTKNGLNASMAATSAARAAELMFSPKAINGLRSVGIAVEDSGGSFRSMEDIIRDLVPIMGSLSDAEKKLKFKEIFGTGRIQARRFFDLAIPNFAELEELIGDMEQSGGGVADAFEFMFSQPISQMDLFRNKWEALRRTIGEAFFATLETKIFPALNRLFDWWDSLTPEMQKQIALWASYAAGALIAAGALLVVLGVGLLFMALLKAFSGTTALAGLSKMAISLGWIGVVLAIIAAAAFLIIRNWDRIWPFLVDVWAKITAAARNFMEANKEFFDAVIAKAKVIWMKLLKLGRVIWERAKIIWAAIWDAMLVFWERWGEDIMNTLGSVWEGIKDTFMTVLNIIIGIIDFFIALFSGDWAGMWEAVKLIASAAWDWLVGKFNMFTAIVSQIWRIVWDFVKEHAINIWNGIKSFLAGIWNGIKNTASGIWNGILDFFKGIWDKITGSARDTIDGKGGLLEFFQNLPGRIISAVFGLGALLIGWIGQAIGWLLEAAITAFGHVLVWFLDLPFKILNVLKAVPSFLWNTGKMLLTGMWNGIKWYYSNIFIPFWTQLLPAVLKGIGNVVSWLFSTGLSLLKGMKRGIVWLWDNLLLPWIKGIKAAVVTGVGKLGSALWQAGKDVIQGFWNGMKSLWGSVTGWVSDKFGSIVDTVKEALWIGSPSRLMMVLGEDTMKGYQLGLKDQMKPINMLMTDFMTDGMFRNFNTGMPTNSSTTNNNENGQTFQFGDIVSQADPDEIAQAIAWEVRMS